MSFHDYTIEQIEKMLQSKEISASELADMSLARIQAVDGDVKAFLTVTEEEAKQKAKALDESGTYDQKLSAIPAAIKDNIVTKGTRTTAASKMLADFHDPLYDATVVEKLAAADAVSMGKVNLDEFAMGSTTETSAFQKTANPWDLNRVPGGSSGGSAAAVAAGEVMFALGTDTGGSIRQPASFCGIVGLKPTYGLVSRYGVVAFAPSLDSIGPMTRTVADNARVLEVIAGHDERDATSSRADVPNYTDALTGDAKGLKIAVPKEFLGDGVSDDVRAMVEAALKTYASLGAEWEEISLSHVADAHKVYYTVSSAEGSSSLARYDGVRFGHRADNAENMIDMYKQSRTEGFGAEVKRRVLLGTTFLTGERNENLFRQAQKVRTLIATDFQQAFEKYDLILGPSTAGPAFHFNEEFDPITMTRNDILAVPANLAGLPALSIPGGFTKDGLPLGLQLFGNHFSENILYRAAYSFEQETDHHKQFPVIGGRAE